MTLVYTAKKIFLVRNSVGKNILGEKKKSQHGCVRWALREHLSPPCSDFACGGLEDCHL